MNARHNPEAAEQALDGNPVEGEEETVESLIFDIPPDQVKDIGSGPSDGLPVLTGEHTQFIALMNDRFESALDWAKNLVITDQASLDIATGNLSTLKKTRKMLDRRREELVKPWNEGKAAVHTPFKSVIDRIDAAVKALGGQTGRYMLGEKQKREAAEREILRREREALEAEQEKIEEQAALNESDQALEDAIDIEKRIEDIDKTKVSVQVKGYGGLSTAGLVMNVDKEAIAEGIQKGVREIPGVRIYQVWTFEILDSKLVPDDYKKATVSNR